MPTCSLDGSISVSSGFYRNIYSFGCSSSLLTVNLAAFAAGAPIINIPQVAITMVYRYQGRARVPIDAGNLVADNGKVGGYRY
jgi:hypothetical protein